MEVENVYVIVSYTLSVIIYRSVCLPENSNS